MTPEGINYELRRLRMTMPKALRGQTLDQASIGSALFAHRHRRLRRFAERGASTMPG